MSKKIVAYVCLAIAVPFVALILYWLGAWVFGVENARTNLVTVSVVAIVFGALFHHLHPDRSNS